MTKEEENELTYLQSLTQAYYTNPQELAEELEQLRGDLTARYTNNNIKKETREKLFTLIDELLASTPEQLSRIAHNEAYLGSQARSTQKTAPCCSTRNSPWQDMQDQRQTTKPQQPMVKAEPDIGETGMVREDGYEWLEWPQGGGEWYYRRAHSRVSWTKWK